MNRFFSLVFSILILIGTVPLSVSAATPGLSAKYNETAAEGKEFEVEISLKNNPGLNGVMIAAEYDTNALSLVSIKNGGLFKTIFSTSQTLSVQPYKIMWITTDRNFEEVTEDGVMVTYVFKVNDNAPLGKTDLNFKVADFSDNKNTKTMNFDNASITINIKKDKVALTEQDTVKGTVDKIPATSSEITPALPSSINKVTSEAPSAMTSASSVNNSVGNTSNDLSQSTSSVQPPKEVNSSAKPVNTNPQEEGKEATPFMPIILIAMVVIVAGIIGAVTLFVKNKGK